MSHVYMYSIDIISCLFQCLSPFLYIFLHHTDWRSPYDKPSHCVTASVPMNLVLVAVWGTNGAAAARFPPQFGCFIQPHRIINKSAGVDTKGHIEEASTPELCEKVRSVEDFQLISWGTVIPPTFDEMNSP